MSNPRIEVEIGAKVDPKLNTGLDEAASKTKAFALNVDILKAKIQSSDKSISSLTGVITGLRSKLENATDVKSIARYNGLLEKAELQLKRVTITGLNASVALQKVQASPSSTQSFNKLGGSIGNANGVAIEFNRIIQDSPFGLIGIGNNIQQLTANFAQLKSTTNAAGQQLTTFAALKATLSAIISPANLLVLAISAVTAGFTAYQMGAFSSKKETEELKTAQETYNESLEATIDGLDSLSSARLDASKGIVSESLKLNTLTKAIENEDNPRKNRIAAISELRDIYPSYLKGLKDEEILTKGLQKAYDEISNSITKRATALSLEGKIVELAKTKLDLNEKLKKDEKDFFILQDELIKKQKALDTLRERGNMQATPARVKIARDERDAILETINTSESLIKTTSDGLKQNTEDANQLGNEYQSIYTDLLGIMGEEESKLKKIKILRTEIAGIQAPGKSTQDFQSAFSPKKIDGTGTGLDFAAQFNLANANLADSVSNAPAISLKPLDIGAFQRGLNEVDQNFEAFGGDFQGAVANFANNINLLVRENLEGAFIDFGFSIGAALANGGNVIDAIGTSLLSSMAKFLGDFGKKLIAFGVAGLAFGKLSVALTNPFTAIGAAPLAIAAGIALTALSGAIGSIGNKGIGGGGGSGSSGVGAVSTGSTFTGSGSNSFDPMRMFKIEVVGSISGEAIGFALAQGQNRKN